MVHDVIEGKDWRWRLRWASVCLPAPNATIDVGDLSRTIFVESREAAAFRMGVSLRALTIAFTAPVVWSRTRVEAGIPRLSSELRGTLTIFIVVPCSPEPDIRAGMNKAVWFGVGMEVRWGVYEVGRHENTRAMRVWSSSGVKNEIILSTSEAERTRSDIEHSGPRTESICTLL